MCGFDMTLSDVLPTVSYASGRDKNGYYHELFLRGNELLAQKIQRFKIKGTGVRKPSSPETEPNFYPEYLLPASNVHQIQNYIAPNEAYLPSIGLINAAASHTNNGLSLQISMIESKIKGTGARKPSLPETEPNFFLKSFLAASNVRQIQNHMVLNEAYITNTGLIAAAARHSNNGLPLQNVLGSTQISSLIESALQASSLQPAARASLVPVPYAFDSRLLASQVNPSIHPTTPSFPSPELLQLVMMMSNTGIAPFPSMGEPVTPRVP
jgi:hypothetical protein